MKKILYYIFIGIFFLLITEEYSFGFVGYEKVIKMNSDGTTTYTYKEFKDKDKDKDKDKEKENENEECKNCINKIDIEELNVYNNRHRPYYYPIYNMPYYPIRPPYYPIKPTPPPSGMINKPMVYTYSITGIKHGPDGKTIL